jgi:general stress protein 26
LWFVTAAGASALEDIDGDPNINLSYYKDGSSEWISVSGKAVASKDPEKIRELYASDWKMWFTENEADPRAGTAEDPRIVLIGVTIEEATFLAVKESKPVVLFELAKGWVTGKSPHIGETHHLKGAA